MTPLQLAANENPLGLPASAREAVARVLSGADRYPDANGTVLRRALAQRLQVPEEGIVLGSGSSEILTMAAQALVRPGEGIVSSQYGFIVYTQAARLVHAKHVVVPARNFGHDLRAMLEAIDASTRLVYVANPNNPTGNFIEGSELLAFLERVPGHCAVLLDEAYTEYLEPQQRYDAVGWTKRLPQLLVARTFSKAYGLAGLRVGYGIAQPALAARLNALRPRFNVTTPALAAAAAALADEDFLERTRETNRQGMAQLSRGFAQLGLRALPSAGNFVLVEVGDGAAVARALAQRGILVSTLEPYGLPRWLRISTGLADQNAQVLQALGALKLSPTA
ncbi:histidinol-phosphate transaminase [Ramlibacter humi]|uniref:Histidinol-phosphate aminotransferase n=1 Tax=Ramlibacter humi TaxID=2530451 RepID=A0A4Z0CB15_9BURK|nr:histidinol-phosphate transaminase [Ramlibacter humi]TFZ07608.1 histidinol-phosphate transaminase [Ramlibacter humi]